MYGNRDYGNRDDSRRSFVPVKVGEEVDVKIEAVGEKGDGVAKIKGFVIFVPNTKAGDEVRVKITRVLRKVGFGEVVGESTGNIVSDTDTKPTEDTYEEGSEEGSEDFDDEEL